MRLTWVCHYEHDWKTLSMELKGTNYLANKKFLAQQSVQQTILTIYLDMNEPTSIDFLEKAFNAEKCFIYPTLYAPYLLNDSG